MAIPGHGVHGWASPVAAIAASLALHPPIDLRVLIRGRLTNPSRLFLARGGASPRRSPLGAVPVARVAAPAAGA